MIGARIFQRSFTTKGRRGLGIGTYFMTFLGENILGGEVGFESTPADGARIYLYLPQKE